MAESQIEPWFALRDPTRFARSPNRKSLEENDAEDDGFTNPKADHDCVARQDFRG